LNNFHERVNLPGRYQVSLAVGLRRVALRRATCVKIERPFKLQTVGGCFRSGNVQGPEPTSTRRRDTIWYGSAVTGAVGRSPQAEC
jgi:hypothetical protein